MIVGAKNSRVDIKLRQYNNTSVKLTQTGHLVGVVRSGYTITVFHHVPSQGLYLVCYQWAHGLPHSIWGVLHVAVLSKNDTGPRARRFEELRTREAVPSQTDRYLPEPMQIMGKTVTTAAHTWGVSRVKTWVDETNKHRWHYTVQVVLTKQILL